MWYCLLYVVTAVCLIGIGIQAVQYVNPVCGTYFITVGIVAIAFFGYRVWLKRCGKKLPEEYNERDYEQQRYRKNICAERIRRRHKI